MTEHKAFRDICNKFEADVRKLSTEFFSAQIGDEIEDVIANKLSDISLYTSKLRLLRAKPNANNLQVSEQVGNEKTALQEYEETAATKVLEQQIVKFLTQSHSVKTLITTPSQSLHPELVERKENIIASLSQYRQCGVNLSQIDHLLKEKEDELRRVRKQWDKELGELRDMRDDVDGSNDVDPGPLHKKLRIIVNKLEIMRWLISKLVTSRTDHYDWLSDPHKCLRALMLAREDNTIEKFMES